eukprot:TRINITY_DN41779_c0_g1_i1.p1 TRINITY_DN41779_c0_g1~~TRINITY_DN41779_c0_g1_i1.p1  ORF type:complete len:401 (+),score=93.99 TRINITY_DN41779_c0_g1_i1:113-1315(+)
MAMMRASKSASLPSLHVPGQEKIKQMVTKPQDNVPESLQNMDYWQAMQKFESFDTAGRGVLSQDQFYRLVCSSTRERMTKGKLDRLFNAVDLDSSGTIDCFEYLGWVFGTDSNYAGAARRRLEDMDQNRVVEFYRALPKHKEEINKEDFFAFISRVSPVEMSREACDDLFDYIDSDGSGGIDLREFLDWLNSPKDKHVMRGVQEARLERKRQTSCGSDASLPSLGGMSRQVSGASSRPQSTGFNTGGGIDMMDKPGMKIQHNGINKLAAANLCQNANSDLFETQPGRPVTLEFTIGPGADGLIKLLQQQLNKDFDGKVDVKVINQRTFKGCQKLRVMVGRGIVLWDKASMIAYMEDPFVTQETAKRWITTILRQCMPNLLGTVNLRRHYARRMGAMGTVH